MIKNVIILILLIVTAWLTYSQYGDTINAYIRTIQKNETVNKTEPVKRTRKFVRKSSPPHVIQRPVIFENSLPRAMCQKHGK